MIEMLSLPLFGITLCLVTYRIGQIIHNRFPSPFTSPLLLSMLMSIFILLVFKIPYSSFQSGGSLLQFFLTPATACLAVSMYRQTEVLKKNLLPILCGCFMGALTAVVSIIFMTKLFGLDEIISRSLYAKSVTTPIAIDLTQSLGGIPAITMLAVTFTGTFGAVFAPVLIRIFKVKDPVARGLGIGASSHGAGTSKAVEIGETEGAMSGIAIGITGVFTVVIIVVLQLLKVL